MKVLCITWEYPPRISGGLGVACHAMNKALRAKGDIAVTLALPASASEPVGDAYALMPTHAVSFAQQCAARFEGGAFDVLHAHDWMSFDAGLELKRRTGAPLVAHVHSLECDRSQTAADPRIVDAEARGLEGADAIVAVSEYTRQRIHSVYGIALSKITTAHNGADARVGRTVLPLPLRSPRITFAGRVTSQKGPLLFLAAAERIAALWPQARFSVVGDGDLLDRMREFASRSPALPIEFHGFLQREAVFDVLGDSRALLMPSLSEPFGLVALEAIAAGTPVAASRHCGFLECIRSVAVFDPTDVEQIAERTLALVRSSDCGKGIADRARVEVSRLHWDRTAETIRAIYFQLASGRSSMPAADGRALSAADT